MSILDGNNEELVSVQYLLENGWMNHEELNTYEKPIAHKYTPVDRYIGKTTIILVKAFIKLGESENTLTIVPYCLIDNVMFGAMGGGYVDRDAIRFKNVNACTLALLLSADGIREHFSSYET